MYRGADKSLACPERKQSRKHVRDARDFNIETGAVMKFFFSCKARQGAKGNSRHSDRNISLFPSCRAKDLSAPLYNKKKLTLPMELEWKSLNKDPRQAFAVKN